VSDNKTPINYANQPVNNQSTQNPTDSNADNSKNKISQTTGLATIKINYGDIDIKK